jgi:hypothetical protein
MPNGATARDAKPREMPNGAKRRRGLASDAPPRRLAFPAVWHFAHWRSLASRALWHSARSGILRTLAFRALTALRRLAFRALSGPAPFRLPALFPEFRHDPRKRPGQPIWAAPVLKSLRLPKTDNRQPKTVVKQQSFRARDRHRPRADASARGREADAPSRG